MKIAVIGSGISGLTCAYRLHKHHDITVYESESSIGGHTATKDVLVAGKHYAIDTGFIVYNDWTYPNFIELMDTLGVASKPTEMSFSVACENTGLEYSGNNLNTLFSQRSNLLKPRFWGMLKDILRFNREAVKDLEDGVIPPNASLGEYLESRGYGETFIHKYLVPMGSAIWSASIDTMKSFPLVFFIRFFKNHGLLSVNDRPQWRVIEGGSGSYLKPLTQGFSDRIHTDCAVKSVRRSDGGVSITLESGEVEVFDEVVFACHSDQALAMLEDPTDEELTVLSAMQYQMNEVVLHTDTQLLPQRELAWASWNYRLPETQQEDAVLTYNMNILQGIEAPVTFCVTLNYTDAIRPEHILGRYYYSHPVFTLESVAACERWEDINGVNKTWFCGAYWANGFHEDGCTSGIRVAEAIAQQSQSSISETAGAPENENVVDFENRVGTGDVA
ncbi:NAD(P)/FAD-dependent oxidoreductase [Pseudomaricurvus sp.]|uniref:NAD(P)/FAD-dependent oxidoreductase n=1 Tax=Pseudomaricurvus sp. TaxID=2004510 RepID=UPI003F6C8689